MSDATEALNATSNPIAPDPSPAAEAAPRKVSPLETELNRASEQCTAYDRLAGRLETVLTALRGRIVREGEAEAPEPARIAPEAKGMSFLDAEKFLNECRDQVRERLERVVGELEDVLGCR